MISFLCFIEFNKFLHLDFIILFALKFNSIYFPYLISNFHFINLFINHQLIIFNQLYSIINHFIFANLIKMIIINFALNLIYFLFNL